MATEYSLSPAASLFRAGLLGGEFCMHRCQRYGGASALAVRSRSSVQWLSKLAFCLVVLTVLEGGEYAKCASPDNSASTSRQAQRAAVEAIPLQKIPPQYRPAVQAVLDDTSLFRRMPTQIVDCDPDIFTYMAQNPEVLVQIWRELGITKVQLTRLDEMSFRLADGAGTTGKLTIVEQMCEPGAQNRIVMYVEGGYEGKPFAKPITAECVLLLRSGSVLETNGRTYVCASLDSFVHLDRSSLELIAKALHPLVGKTADKNFADTVAFIGNFSQAAEVRPQQIERLTNSLENVSPLAKRRLIDLAYASEEQQVSDQPDPPAAGLAHRPATTESNTATRTR